MPLGPEKRTSHRRVASDLDSMDDRRVPAMIDKHYGHLLHDTRQAMPGLGLDGRPGAADVKVHRFGQEFVRELGV
jgi:hypothetical protein